MNFLKENAYERAKIKLACIISREGDANGARLSEGYFNQLVNEAERDIFFENVSIGGTENV